MTACTRTNHGATREGRKGMPKEAPHDHLG